MQLEFPVYGVEGEEAACANGMVVRAINSDEDAVPVGHIVRIDAEKDTCCRVTTKEHLEKCVLGVVLSRDDKNEFKVGESVRILRRGRVYVHLDSKVKAAGESVFVNARTGGFGGNETPDAVQLKRAFFLSAGASGDVVLLELDLLLEDRLNEDDCRTRLR